MSNKLTPLQVVERYYERYLEYEKAFMSDPFDREKVSLEVKRISDSGADMESEETMDKLAVLVVEKPQKQGDVNTAAIRFIMAVDFYNQVEETALPTKLKEDFEKLPIKSEMKVFYSVEAGKFVRNEEVEMDEHTKSYIRSVVNQIKEM